VTHTFFVLLGAGLISMIGTWGFAHLAGKIGAVSHVRADRWHTSGDVPRLAGPALLLAMAAWLPPAHTAILALVCLIGAIDDARRLPPAIKGAALLIAAIIAAYVTGSVSVAIAIWIACNAVNLLDHADGIAAAACAAAFVAVGGDAGYAGAGACLGFLILNYPPARVFMGDSGSLTLGAALVLSTSHLGMHVTTGVLAVPLLDAAFVVTRRLAAGRKPWIGGTDHTGHLLLMSGVPAWVLPLLYGAAAFAIAITVVSLR
jgi:UDP-GlcNAc:undecaprenyl-phosphate GlcNAc-1-phosphate transferase